MGHGTESFDVSPEDVDVVFVEPNGESTSLLEVDPNVDSANALIETLSELEPADMSSYIPEMGDKIEALKGSGITSSEVSGAIAFLENFLSEAESARSQE